jgi:hypothetical protein
MVKDLAVAVVSPAKLARHFGSESDERASVPP